MNISPQRQLFQAHSGRESSWAPLELTKEVRPGCSADRILWVVPASTIRTPWTVHCTAVSLWAMSSFHTRLDVLLQSKVLNFLTMTSKSKVIFWATNMEPMLNIKRNPVSIPQLHCNQKCQELFLCTYPPVSFMRLSEQISEPFEVLGETLTQKKPRLKSFTCD